MDKIISRGMFAYSFSFMTKKELIQYCKQNNLYFKNSMTKNKILEIIQEHKKEILITIFFKKNELYKTLRQIILSYLSFDDNIVIYRKLELKRCLNITSTIPIEIVSKQYIIDWFIKHNFAISKDKLETILQVKLEELYKQELDKAFFISKGLYFICKDDRKKWLRYLKYNKIEQEILSLDKKTFNNNYLSLLLN